jgi:hypothetical protein
VEHGRVDGSRRRRHRKRARGVAEEDDAREPRPAERRAEVGSVEHPDVGTTDALGGELRIVEHAVERAVLAAVRGGDEGARSARTREHDVARLVADQERTRDPRRVRRHVDDAHAVGEQVHDPHLGIGARRDGDRLEPDRHRAGVHR